MVLFRNYIVYLIIGILATFTENMVLAYKANKMYPYLKEKDAKELDKKEKKGIMQNVKSLVIYKIGGVIMNGTDNILISSMINVTTVGYCSNYTLIINAVTSIVTSALNGLTASVGNLNAVGDKKRKEEIFYLITFAILTLSFSIIPEFTTTLSCPKESITNCSFSFGSSIKNTFFFIVPLISSPYASLSTVYFGRFCSA